MGTTPKSPSPLAPFACDWVGGDIHGLSAFAGTLYSYQPGFEDVAAALGRSVSRTVGAGGWQGTAASAFSKAWDRDSAGATALGTLTTGTAEVVDWLAVTLSKIESALEKAAGQATAHGVPVGANGQPPAVCLADPAAQRWLASYQAFYNQAMLAAVHARNTAAAALQRIFGAITGSGLEPGDRTAWCGLLAGFLGAQTRYRGYVEGKLARLKQAVSDARQRAIADARQADGRFGAWSAEDRQAVADARANFASAQDQLAGAQSSENWLSKAWGFSAGDIAPVANAVDGMGGLAGKLAKFGADIPVVDLATAGAGTYFSAQADIAQGVPAPAAYTGEAAGNVAALAAGGEVGALATGGAATVLGALGATGVGLSVGAGAAGVAVGGVVAYGVGDFAHNLIDQNWGADFSKYGVLDGLGHGIAGSAVQTGKDFAHTADTIWHGITSIF